MLKQFFVDAGNLIGFLFVFDVLLVFATLGQAMSGCAGCWDNFIGMQAQWVLNLFI